MSLNRTPEIIARLTEENEALMASLKGLREQEKAASLACRNADLRMQIVEAKIHMLLECCAKEYGVTVPQIRSRCRIERIVAARQVAMSVLRSHGMTCSKVAELVCDADDVDHGTVLNAAARVEARKLWPLEGDRIRRIFQAFGTDFFVISCERTSIKVL